MLYKIHKDVGYIVSIHMSDKHTLEVFFPNNVLESNLPRYIRYELTNEGLLYSQDNDAGILYPINPDIFRLAIMIDLTIKCNNYNISDELCEGFDTDGDVLPYTNASEIIITLLKTNNEAAESNIYHYLLNDIGDITGLEKETTTIHQLLEHNGFGNFLMDTNDE